LSVRSGREPEVVSERDAPGFRLAEMHPLNLIRFAPAEGSELAACPFRGIRASALNLSGEPTRRLADVDS
jgi:hypothetical protein